MRIFPPDPPSPKELVHCGSAVRKRLMVHILNVFVAMPSDSL